MIWSKKHDFAKDGSCQQPYSYAPVQGPVDCIMLLAVNMHHAKNRLGACAMGNDHKGIVNPLPPRCCLTMKDLADHAE